MVDDFTRYVLGNRWAVVGFDYDTAKQIIAGIEASSGKEVLIRAQTRHRLYTEFTDGTLLEWIKVSNSIKGKRFGKMWCDKNIDEDIFRSVIMPMYFGEKKDIIWI